jgi:hypothetical protein
MYFGIPQIIFIALVCISLGVDSARHGKKVTRTENAFISFLAIALTLSILAAGGFFNQPCQ